MITISPNSFKIKAKYKDTTAIGYTTISTVITNIILGIFLIGEFEVYGVSFAHCIANFIMFQHRKFYVNKYIKLDKCNISNAMCKRSEEHTSELQSH